jgi:hypothetical protein
MREAESSDERREKVKEYGFFKSLNSVVKERV